MDKRLAYQHLVEEGSRTRFITFTGEAKRDEIWTTDTFFPERTPSVQTCGGQAEHAN